MPILTMVSPGLQFGWKSPNTPTRVAADFLDSADSLDDVVPPLALAREIIIDDVAMHFDLEQDPAGSKWIPLNEQYREKKLNAGYPDNILERETYMRDEATSREAWQIIPPAIRFEPSAMVQSGEYWFVHQEGGYRPERPFIGVSAEAQAAIYSLFSTWVDRAMYIAAGLSGDSAQARAGFFGATKHRGRFAGVPKF